MTYVKDREDVLSEISQKLDVLIGLLVAREMGEADAAAIFQRLRNMNLSPKVIARVLGISENAANIRLSRLRRR